MATKSAGVTVRINHLSTGGGAVKMIAVKEASVLVGVEEANAATAEATAAVVVLVTPQGAVAATIGASGGIIRSNLFGSWIYDLR